MTSAESASTAAERDTVDPANEHHPSQGVDPVDRSVSWESIAPNRFRSFVAGGLGGIIGLALVAVATHNPPLISGEWLSVDPLAWVGGLVVVAGALALGYWLSTANGPMDGERDAVTERLGQQSDWTWIRPVWVGCGVVVSGITIWSLGGAAASLHLFPMAALWVSLLFQEWGVRRTVDPEAGVVEANRPSYTRRRSLDWAVGVRRFDVLGRSLFVVSNRGKRWYTGIHFLPVPAALASQVDATLQRVVDENESPERIRRDERIITAAVGVSMLAVGPLLYLLSGEGALLLIAAGPSAIIAHGLLLHATRG